MSQMRLLLLSGGSISWRAEDGLVLFKLKMCGPVPGFLLELWREGLIFS